ncbi:unnamed protein product, partial [Closterium sp. NIES-53]
ALPSSPSRTLVPVAPVSSPSACRASPSCSLAHVAPVYPVASRCACPSRPVTSRLPYPSRRVAPVPSRPVPSPPLPSPRACCPCPSSRAAPCPSRHFLHASAMATPSVLRFDAEGRPLDLSVWLLRTQRLLESQVQADEFLWAHASSDLRASPDPEPVGADPTTADRDRFARQCAALNAWKSRDAAACIALSSLLPESEETHFTQVRTASEFLTAIKASVLLPLSLLVTCSSPSCSLISPRLNAPLT